MKNFQLRDYFQSNIQLQLVHGQNHGTFTCERKAHSRAESGGPGSAQHAAICSPGPPRRNFSTMKCSTTIYTIHIYQPRSGGPAATTAPQFQGENPDCQPRVLAPSQAAELPPPHPGGRRSAGGLTLPPQPSAGCPRSGPASWLFEPAPQWSAAAATTTWRRPSAAWPSGRTPTVPMPGIAWTARCRWRGVQPEPLTGCPYRGWGVWGRTGCPPALINMGPAQRCKAIGPLQDKTSRTAKACRSPSQSLMSSKWSEHSSESLVCKEFPSPPFTEQAVSGSTVWCG